MRRSTEREPRHIPTGLDGAASGEMTEDRRPTTRHARCQVATNLFAYLRK